MIVVSVNDPVSPNVGSTSHNILSPSLASKMESLSLTSDVTTTVITPVSCYGDCLILTKIESLTLPLLLYHSFILSVAFMFKKHLTSR